VKLSAWARQQAITYRRAWRSFWAGTVPVRAERTPGGTILMKPGSISSGARVSSSDQKSALDGQAARLVSFANSPRPCRLVEDL
jgi:predicted site-specific integrase-resolvase